MGCHSVSLIAPLLISKPSTFQCPKSNSVKKLNAAVESVTVYGFSCQRDGCEGVVAQYTDLDSGTFVWGGSRTDLLIDQSTTTIMAIQYSITCTPNLHSTKPFICDEQHSTVSSVVGVGASTQTGGVYGYGRLDEILRTTVIDIITTNLPPLPLPTLTSRSVSELSPFYNHELISFWLFTNFWLLKSC
jgi:hypothetical protein